jgi:hypothetical protein
MRKQAFLGLAVVGLALAQAAPATAQHGFALKGHYLLNSSTADAARADGTIPSADGLGLGAEYVLPGGLGFGVSGYTAGSPKDVDYKTTEFTFVGELNYFLRLPVVPLAPYVGVHAGLGTSTGDDVSVGDVSLGDRSRSQLGYQVGLRFQPTGLIGLDAQWRHVSTSAFEGQDGRLERNQVLLGITLF